MLRERMEENDCDGFLAIDDSSNTDVHYLSDFESEYRPYLLLHTFDETIVMPFSEADEYRVRESETVTEVRTRSEFDFQTKVEEAGVDGLYSAYMALFDELISEYDIERIAVSDQFSVLYADRLREYGYELEILDRPLHHDRLLKDSSEIDQIRSAVRGAERAMESVRDLLSTAEIGDNDVLEVNGSPLEAADIRREIQIELVKNDCHHPGDIVVSCGDDSGIPYEIGSGTLYGHEPIIVDIEPRHASNYCADLCRTFVKGTASNRVRTLHEQVSEALERGIDLLSNGTDSVMGRDVYAKVCDCFEDAGFSTFRTDGTDAHFPYEDLGHGIGMNVHNEMALNEWSGRGEARYVTSIEPALYDDGVGVVLEDVVHVTEQDCDVLSEFDRTLEL